MHVHSRSVVLSKIHHKDIKCILADCMWMKQIHLRPNIVQKHTVPCSDNTCETFILIVIFSSAFTVGFTVELFLFEVSCKSVDKVLRMYSNTLKSEQLTHQPTGESLPFNLACHHSFSYT